MSLENESAEQLQRHLEELENSAMLMSAEGISLPDDLIGELQEIQSRLSQFASPGLKPWTAWLGQTIEGYVLKGIISSGTYSYLFRAVNDKTDEQCVVKIANSTVALPAPEGNYFAKQAICFNTEMMMKLEIAPNTVIKEEYAKLANSKSNHFIKPLSAGMINNCNYYRMPALEGQSLKQLMQLTDMPFMQIVLEIFQRLSSIVDEIGSTDRFHGNLQPDSIFITKQDIVLLSPGVFDLSDEDVCAHPFFISTPAYYPFFEPNDLYALACTFWEAICKRHPLDCANGEDQSSLFDSELKQMLEYRKALMHEPLCEFLKLRLPSQLRSDLNTNAEAIMLKALKLTRHGNGTIGADPGFQSAEDFSKALSTLSDQDLIKRP